MTRLLVPLLCLMIFTAAVATAQVAQMVNYQGRLLDDSGKPYDGQVSLTFALYDDSTAGTMLWTESFADVSVTDGLFSVILNFDSQPVDFPVYENLFVGIQVAGDPELLPRTRLTFVPQALRTYSIEGAQGGMITGVVEITDRITIGPDNINTGKHSLTIGSDNTADSDYSSVSGGIYNSAIAEGATVSGGGYNVAGGLFASIGGGYLNYANGLYGCVPGGIRCDAGGAYSVAMGNRAKALHDGSVVIAASFCPD